jgi:RNA polymerase sigma-70 factor (ECF subfamily)
MGSTSASVQVGADQLEEHRRELTGYCYRMLGSSFEADDAVQETLLRAWRAADGFEGRSSVRSWLYRIATNICLDMLRSRQRRALPIDLGPASAPVETLLGEPRPDDAWVSPIADSRIMSADPAEIAVARESIRLAFVAALQHLPARQRAALILCEVLKMPAAEAAATLAMSVPAINSALQRARATMAAVSADSPPSGAPDSALIDQYVDAFQRYDMSALVKLLHDDAVMSMPPFSMWLRGKADIVEFMLQPGVQACRGSRWLPVQAGPVNGVLALAQYRRAPEGGYAAWGLQVHEAAGGRFTRLTYFLDTERLFPEFGLPDRVS